MLQKPAAVIFESQLLKSGLLPQESLWESVVKFYQVSGLTCITATDDSKVAMKLATRIAILKDGILQQVDTPQNLINHSANTFVSEFISTP